MANMRAVVLHHPEPPEPLKLETRPIPAPAVGQVLIQIKAFGRSRSELFGYLGWSPNVNLPRVLPIEAVSLVHEVLGGEFGKEK